MADNAYSRFVAILRIVLPLVAIGLLSTLFLFSRKVDPERAIPFAEVDVEAILREERVNQPTYTSVTQKGTAVSVSAKSVLTDVGNADNANADEIVARLDFPSGTRALISSAKGNLDSPSSILNLEGGVVILTSDGLRIETAALTTSLVNTDIRTQGTVTAEGSLGTLTAGQMHLTETGGENGSYVAVFNKGVKLVYRPGDTGDER
ncbi:LPS export ABC transporter periplasmic protein LptC [Actibacterium mucosum]|uniref:LPS export ABC transporter periplasmic protein LptC n=1 Tax=Actibacterium mucosum TaxID=1087332 RepID=UPI00137753BF|nr:LPS export ABC transporter periplasmic protein LptC [Actibacterium mucosum]